MTKVGKLFKKTPYFVKDINRIHKDIKFVEELIKNLINEEQIEENNLVYIFSNNRDNTLHFHLLLKNSINKEHLISKFRNENVEFTFQYFTETKTKTSKVNTYLFIETFKHLQEYELANAFNHMISCDGEKLSLCIQKEDLNLFQPDNIQYRYRNIILEKEEFVKDTCITFDISYEKLFEDLNPNLIKQVCKDLNLTYKKLSFELGYKPDTINKAASTGKVSEQLKKAIHLYLENLRLQNELQNLEFFKEKLNGILV
ncbi:hypothetical protein ACH5BF_01225 [Arcobacter sp. YIC-464]|uniref:hypothetical protein n=1 Tax=Arcobacter sp. YIC-464 TaxID=3376631 RepID=UPI003C1AAD9A